MVTLLRSVGHVLEKVDGNRSVYLKGAASEVWKEVKRNRNKNAIFFEFIEIERNNILKEYKVGEFIVYPMDCSEKWRKADYPMPFGERVLSQSVLIQEAVDWWESLLYEVETKAETRLRTTVRRRRPARRNRKAG